jgi:aspartate 1-decarboxylase
MTNTNGAAAKKTRSGYAVRISGFIEVAKQDTDRHEAVMAAVNAARRGSPEKLLALIAIEDVATSSVARQPVPEKPAPKGDTQ